MRIGKFLSRAGLCSRRGAADFLKENRVMYNDQVIERLDFDVAEGESVQVGEKTYKISNVPEVYILNKPPGYICSHKEHKNEKTIFRLLPDSINKYYFAGRLDEMSRGLVILSNDGDLIYKLTHPSMKAEKIYNVITSRPLSAQELAKMVEGVWCNGEKLKAKKITKLEKVAHYQWVLVEGKNRQIRRMVENVGAKVTDLFRLSMGEYKLNNLEPGKFRKL